MKYSIKYEWYTKLFARGTDPSTWIETDIVIDPSETAHQNCCIRQHVTTIIINAPTAADALTIFKTNQPHAVVLEMEWKS